MKTNTTHLRRALTAFAMTGAIFAISDFCTAESLVISDQTPRPVSVVNKDVVIAPNSAAVIDVGGGVFFKSSGINTLTAPGYTFTNSSNPGKDVDGSVIYGGNWTINGGSFVGNSVIAANSAGMAWADGGAIASDNIDVVGNTSFINNKVEAASTYKDKVTGTARAWGGAIAAIHQDYGKVYIGSAATVDTILFDGNNAHTSALVTPSERDKTGAWGGAIGLWDGDLHVSADSGDSIIFRNNSATGEYNRAKGGAICVGHVGSDASDHLQIIGSEDSRILFENNHVYTAHDNAYGGAIYARCRMTIENATFLNNVNTAGDNGGAAYGGAICTWGDSGSRLESIFRNVTMNGNRAQGTYAFGGAISSYYTFDTIYFSGDNEFKNNTVQWEISSILNGGGAIQAYNVVFEGDDSTAVFSGNRVNGGNNDLHILNTLTFKDTGKYLFEGGITTMDGAKMSILGSDVTLQEGSLSRISDTLTLENAKLTIETNGTTPLYVGSIVDNGGNCLHIDYRTDQSSWVIIGDVSDLEEFPTVTYSALLDGEFGRIRQMDTKGLYIEIIREPGAFLHVYADGTPDVSENKLNKLGDVRVNDEIFVVKDPTAPTPGLTANGKLRIASNNEHIRTITADGDSTLIANASELTLENVILTTDSTTVPVISGTTDVDLTGGSTAGIIAANTIIAENVTLGGRIFVDGKITGNVMIREDAEVAITQNTDIIDGGLIVEESAKLVLDSLGMSKSPVYDEDGEVVEGETQLTFDSIDVTGKIEFADGSTVELVFDETFNLDGRGTYTLMTHAEGVTDLDGVEFIFADLATMIDGIQMLEVVAVDGAILLNVTGYGTVPEPATWVLLVLGGLGVFGTARKNRKAKK